jgi:excisionase family DNA binding protein
MQTDVALASPTPTRAVAAEDPWLKLAEAAARAKASPETLRRAIKAKQLRHARVSGRKSIRIRASWVDAWLEATSTPVEVR